MKNIEKDILLKDLDYVYNELELKKEKLNSIVSLFMDEEPELVKNKVDQKIKETEKKVKDIEEKEIEEKIEEEFNENIDQEKIEELNSKNIIELDKDLKTLYRKVVMLIHPDKNKNDSNKEYYKSLYKRIIEAKNNNDKADIIYISYKLNIKDVYDIDPEHFGSIRKKIKMIEMESKNIIYNSFWVWYHTDNKHLKDVMVSQIKKR